MKIRNCLLKITRDILTCQEGHEPENACMEAASAVFDFQKNKGWAGGQAFLTPEPKFTVSC